MKITPWIAGLVSALVLTGCAGSIEPERGNPRLGATVSPGTHGLEWFGFVGVRCQLDDPNDEEATSDYVNEVSGFTNLAHVCVFDNDVHNELGDLPEHGLRALLDVTLVLFEFTEGEAPTGSGQRYVLRADAQSSWDSFVATNADVLDADHVGAYYLVDEPIWNGATPADIEAAVAIVERDAGKIPSVIVEAPGALEDAVFPKGVDWVGFDLYGVTNPVADPAYQANLATLRERARPEQQIAVVLDSQWLPVFGEIGIEQGDLATIARNYYALATREPDVVALIGYTWPGGIDADQLGARDLPAEVRGVYEEIGREIVDP
jgi:hypothetical protein